MKTISTVLIRTDEELMRDYQAGQSQSFEELVLRYETALYNFTLIYFRDPSTAEDILQDIIIKVVENRHRYDPERPFKPWIYRIARNRIFDELRKNQRWYQRFLPSGHQGFPDDRVPRDSGDYPARTPSPQKALAVKELSVILYMALQDLDSRSRELIILRHLQGLPVRDVALILDMNEGTVHSGTHRAIAKLQEALLKRGIRKEDIL